MFLKISKLLFLILIFSLGFMQPSLRFLKYRIPLTELIFLILFVFFLAAVFKREIKIRFGSFYIPLVFYFFSLLVSTIFSANIKISFVKLFGEIYLLCLAILAFNLIDSREFFKKICFSWLAATFFGCAVCLISVLLFYLDRNNLLLNYTLSLYGSLPSGNYPRIQGTFSNPNMLCNYLNASLIFGLIAFKFGWLKKELCVIFALIFAITTAFTISPGIGGILLTLGVWCGIYFKENKNNLAALASFFVGISGAILFFLSTLPSPVNFPAQIEPSPRVLCWFSAWEIFTNNFIYGLGVGANAANITYTDLSGNIEYLKDAHQLWLNVAAQQGIIGLAAILFITVFFARKIFPLNFGKSDFDFIRVSLGLAFCGVFICQGFIGSYEDARYLWILIGLLGFFSLPNNKTEFAETE